MKKIISLILIFAMFSSLVLPAYAEDTYGAEITLTKSEYSSSEHVTGSITVLKNGQAVKGLTPVYKIYSGDIEKYASDGITDRAGIFSFDTPLSNYDMGTARIEVYFDGKILASKNFTVINTSTSFIDIAKDVEVLGDNVTLTGTFYSNGNRAVNEDVVYKILKGSTEIAASTTRTDKNGQINVEIPTIGSHYTPGDYKVLVTHDKENYTEGFTLTAKEVTLNFITINNKISTLAKDAEHTFSSSAVYSDNNTEIVTPVYASSDASVVSVSGQKITAVSFGTAVITATYEDKTDTVTVTVPEENVLTISTDKSSYALHDTMTITALKPDSESMDVILKVYNGNTLISSMPSRLDKSGMATWDFDIKEDYKAGTYKLEVILDKTSQSIFVTVMDYGYHAIINVSDHMLGQKLAVTGTLKDTNGNILKKSDAILKLKKGNELLATKVVRSDIDGKFSSNDMLLNYGVGTYTLELYDGALLASKSFEVNAALLESIAFESVSSSVKIPATLPLKVVALYGDGSKVDITNQYDLLLSTSNGNLALIKETVLHPNSQGTVVITASYKGFTATHSVVIEAKSETGTTPDDTPNTPNNTPVNNPVATVQIALDQLEVELEYGTQSDPAFFEYDLTETITGSEDENVTWEIADDTVASVTQEGVVKALKAGVTVVTATHDISGASTTVNIIVFLVGEEQTPLGAIEFFEPYVQGYPDGSFGPLRAVTRAEVATMFTKILKIDTTISVDAKFSDVIEGMWYYDYVQAIEKTGLFVGDGDGTFRPNDPISRGELATVFSKYWRYLNIEVNDKAVYIPDVNGEHWASGFIYTLYNAGIKSTFEDSTYRPNAPALREQVVGMINTLIARPANFKAGSKFIDITSEHWAYGDIEAASQAYVKPKVVEEKASDTE